MGIIYHCIQTVASFKRYYYQDWSSSDTLVRFYTFAILSPFLVLIIFSDLLIIFLGLHYISYHEEGNFSIWYDQDREFD